MLNFRNAKPRKVHSAGGFGHGVALANAFDLKLMMQDDNSDTSSDTNQSPVHGSADPFSSPRRFAFQSTTPPSSPDHVTPPKSAVVPNKGSSGSNLNNLWDTYRFLRLPYSYNIDLFLASESSEIILKTETAPTQADAATPCQPARITDNLAGSLPVEMIIGVMIRLDPQSLHALILSSKTYYNIYTAHKADIHRRMVAQFFSEAVLPIALKVVAFPCLEIEGLSRVETCRALDRFTSKLNPERYCSRPLNWTDDVTLGKLAAFWPLTQDIPMFVQNYAARAYPGRLLTDNDPLSPDNPHWQWAESWFGNLFDDADTPTYDHLPLELPREGLGGPELSNVELPRFERGFLHWDLLCKTHRALYEWEDGTDGDYFRYDLFDEQTERFERNPFSMETPPLIESSYTNTMSLKRVEAFDTCELHEIEEMLCVRSYMADMAMLLLSLADGYESKGEWNGDLRPLDLAVGFDEPFPQTPHTRVTEVWDILPSVVAFGTTFLAKALRNEIPGLRDVLAFHPHMLLRETFHTPNLVACLLSKQGGWNSFYDDPFTARWGEKDKDELCKGNKAFDILTTEFNRYKRDFGNPHKSGFRDYNLPKMGTHIGMSRLRESAWVFWDEARLPFLQMHDLMSVVDSIQHQRTLSYKPNWSKLPELTMPEWQSEEEVVEAENGGAEDDDAATGPWWKKKVELITIGGVEVMVIDKGW